MAIDRDRVLGLLEDELANVVLEQRVAERVAGVLRRLSSEVGRLPEESTEDEEPEEEENPDERAVLEALEAFGKTNPSGFWLVPGIAKQAGLKAYQVRLALGALQEAQRVEHDGDHAHKRGWRLAVPDAPEPPREEEPAPHVALAKYDERHPPEEPAEDASIVRYDDDPPPAQREEEMHAGPVLPPAAEEPRPAPRRDAVRDALFGQRDWVKTSAIRKTTGLSMASIHTALRRLRDAGVAEHNGERTNSSRWRAVRSASDHQTITRAPNDRQPAQVVRLEVVDVGLLTSAEQRFRCIPFNATIAARTCIDRQTIAGSRVIIGTAKGIGARQKEIDTNSKSRQYHSCKDCPLGRQVATRLGAVAPRRA